MINHPLPFIRTNEYFGPDRRRQDIGAPAGMTERRAGGVEARTKTG